MLYLIISTTYGVPPSLYKKGAFPMWVLLWVLLWIMSSNFELDRLVFNPGSLAARNRGERGAGPPELTAAHLQLCLKEAPQSKNAAHKSPFLANGKERAGRKTKKRSAGISERYRAVNHPLCGHRL